MQAYLWVRSLGEAMIREARTNRDDRAAMVRAWSGPSWPKAIMPLYKLAEMIPATRATAERLGLVTIEQFVNAMVRGAENPPASGQRRIVDVPAIRRARL